MILAKVQQTGFQNFKISFNARLNVIVECGLVKISGSSSIMMAIMMVMVEFPGKFTNTFKGFA